MLTVWDSIQARRSVRHFDASRDVPNEMVQQLLEAGRKAQSGGNRQPWRFLVVRDSATKAELRRIKGLKFIEEAPVIIVVFGDIGIYLADSAKKRAAEAEAAGTATPESSRRAQYFLTMDHEQALMHVAANTYVSISYIILMAASMGLGTCWLGTTSYLKELSQFLGYPENLLPLAMIAVGYPAGEVPPQAKRLEMEKLLLKK